MFGQLKGNMDMTRCTRPHSHPCTPTHRPMRKHASRVTLPLTQKPSHNDSLTHNTIDVSSLLMSIIQRLSCERIFVEKHYLNCVVCSLITHLNKPESQWAKLIEEAALRLNTSGYLQSIEVRLKTCHVYRLILPL